MTDDLNDLYGFGFREVEKIMTDEETPEYQAFMADCAKRCRCSTPIVCASVLQGGPCEDIQEDDRGVERYFDFDEYDE